MAVDTAECSTGHISRLRDMFIMNVEVGGWWGEQDSNLRRRCHQIYSLTPLAAREPPQGDKDPSVPRCARERFGNQADLDSDAGCRYQCITQVGLRPPELCSRAIPCVFRCDGAIRSTKVDGASDGARTHDLLITNQGLYQLSYTGFPRR